MKGLIKFFISIGMLGLVLRFTDFAELGHIIAAVPAGVIAVLVTGYALGQCMSAYKWWLLARAGGIYVPFTTALKASFIGTFVNCFGFGTVGGDLARGILLSGDGRIRAGALGSVIADRAHGLAVLSTIGIVAAACISPDGLDPTYRLLLLGLAGCIALGWLVGPHILLKLVPRDTKLRAHAEEVARAFPKDPRQVILITLISAAFHLLQLSLHLVMAYGIGVKLTMTKVLVSIPFVNILSTLPISWQGLGVRENSYLIFLGDAVTREQALAFGALWLLAVTVTSACGGIVSVLSGDLKAMRAVRAEQRQQA